MAECPGLSGHELEINQGSKIHSIQATRKGLQISMDRPGQARVQNPKGQTGQWELDPEARMVELRGMPACKGYKRLF